MDIDYRLQREIDLIEADDSLTPAKKRELIQDLYREAREYLRESGEMDY